MKTIAKVILTQAIFMFWVPVFLLAAESIRHDAEHYVLLHQYAEKWAAEDKELDLKLAEIRQKNGGKPPNIVYILIDDMGFGEFGMPELNRIRGGRTPKLDKLAKEGITFTRMYAENICTSTRVAFMTGRYAVRTGMGNSPRSHRPKASG